MRLWAKARLKSQSNHDAACFCISAKRAENACFIRAVIHSRMVNLAQDNGNSNFLHLYIRVFRVSCVIRVNNNATNMKEINDDELQFVARHYEENGLDAERALRTVRQRMAPSARRKTDGETHLSSSTRRISASTRRIAASVSIALIVSASVACGVWYARHWNTQQATPEAPTASVNTPFRYLQPAGESIVMKYDNAPIEDVLSEVSTYYGRQLVLQSASASNRHISGEFEATSLEEVVEILEATLEIEIEIQNK